MKRTDNNGRNWPEETDNVQREWKLCLQEKAKIIYKRKGLYGFIKNQFAIENSLVLESSYKSPKMAVGFLHFVPGSV